ncbi:hypothetical protein ABE354_08635 [Brevibacillus laterosporus]|uniref:hypothetical protein n=1 Tax=Brevibacillus laterosporus TaxID=1465 RepID=UPI003D1D33C2
MEKQVAIEPTFEDMYERFKKGMNTLVEYWCEISKRIQAVFRENPLFAELCLSEVKQDRKKQRKLYYRKKRSQARKKWRK